jgi:hypothetical protein
LTPGRGRARRGGQVRDELGAELGTAQRDHARDLVGELAHVARPVVGEQALERFARDARPRLLPERALSAR